MSEELESVDTGLTELIGKVSILEGRKGESVEAYAQYEEALQEAEVELFDRYEDPKAEELFRYLEQGQFETAYEVIDREW